MSVVQNAGKRLIQGLWVCSRMHYSTSDTFISPKKPTNKSFPCDFMLKWCGRGMRPPPQLLYRHYNTPLNMNSLQENRWRDYTSPSIKLFVLTHHYHHFIVEKTSHWIFFHCTRVLFSGMFTTQTPWTPSLARLCQLKVIMGSYDSVWMSVLRLDSSCCSWYKTAGG